MLKLISLHPRVRLQLFAMTIAIATTAFATACDDIATGEPEATPEGEPGDDVTTLDIAEAILGIVDTCDAYIVQVGFLDQFATAEDLAAQLQRDVDNPNVVFNQEAANACHAYIVDGGYCDALNSGAIDSEDCDRIFEGVFVVGDDCDSNECAFGLTCRSNGNECGLCEALPLEGDPCDGQCASGLDCDFENGAGVCAQPPPPPAVGDVCVVNSNDCGTTTGLTCIDGACGEITIVRVGDACDGTEIVCAPILSTTCSGEENGPFTCRNLPELGEPCEDIRNCQDGFCDSNVLVCTAFRAVDEVCGFGECESGLFCENSVCIPFDDPRDEQCTE